MRLAPRPVVVMSVTTLLVSLGGQGACERTCSVDADCGEGRFCHDTNAGKTCDISCGNGYECEAGAFCNDNTCVRGSAGGAEVLGEF